MKQQIFRILLSVVMVFAMLGTICGTQGNIVLGNDLLLERTAIQSGAGQKAFDTFKRQIAASENATGIGTDYVDMLDPSIFEVLQQEIIAYNWSFVSKDEAPPYDTYWVEITVEEYFKDYALKNNIAVDETFETAMEKTMESMTQEIIEVNDIYHLETLRSAGILAKLAKLRIPLMIATAVCLALCIACFCLFGWQRRYWTSCCFLSSGILLFLPAFYIYRTGVISHFTYKEPAVYGAVTAMLNRLLDGILQFGVVLFAIGLVVMIITILRPRAPKNITADENI